MKWLEKIQHKSHDQKVRIIWAVIIIVFIFLIAAWVISAKYGKKVPKDNTLIETLDQGIKDVQENYRK